MILQGESKLHTRDCDLPADGLVGYSHAVEPKKSPKFLGPNNAIRTPDALVNNSKFDLYTMHGRQHPSNRSQTSEMDTIHLCSVTAEKARDTPHCPFDQETRSRPSNTVCLTAWLHTSVMWQGS